MKQHTNLYSRFIYNEYIDFCVSLLIEMMLYFMQMKGLRRKERCYKKRLLVSAKSNKCKINNLNSFSAYRYLKNTIKNLNKKIDI